MKNKQNRVSDYKLDFGKMRDKLVFLTCSVFGFYVQIQVLEFRFWF